MEGVWGDPGLLTKFLAPDVDQEGAGMHLQSSPLRRQAVDPPTRRLEHVSDGSTLRHVALPEEYAADADPRLEPGLDICRLDIRLSSH